jgi:hypothetical protein
VQGTELVAEDPAWATRSFGHGLPGAPAVIQLGRLDIELGPHHPPRLAQPQRRREQPQLIHTPVTLRR